MYIQRGAFSITVTCVYIFNIKSYRNKGKNYKTASTENRNTLPIYVCALEAKLRNTHPRLRDECAE